MKHETTNSTFAAAACAGAFGVITTPQGIGARGPVRSNADSAVRTWSPPA